MKKETLTQVFSCKFYEFLRTPFLPNTSGRLLLSLDILKDTEMKAKVNGVKSQMDKFEFIFCCLLGEKVLKQTDNLSRILQDPTISLSEGNQLGI